MWGTASDDLPAVTMVTGLVTCSRPERPVLSRQKLRPLMMNMTTMKAARPGSDSSARSAKPLELIWSNVLKYSWCFCIFNEPHALQGNAVVHDGAAARSPAPVPAGTVSQLDSICSAPPTCSHYDLGSGVIDHMRTYFSKNVWTMLIEPGNVFSSESTLTTFSHGKKLTFNTECW